MNGKDAKMHIGRECFIVLRRNINRLSTVISHVEKILIITIEGYCKKEIILKS